MRLVGQGGDEMAPRLAIGVLLEADLGEQGVGLRGGVGGDATPSAAAVEDSCWPGRLAEAVQVASGGGETIDEVERPAHGGCLLAAVPSERGRSMDVQVCRGFPRREIIIRVGIATKTEIRGASPPRRLGVYAASS